MADQDRATLLKNTLDAILADQDMQPKGGKTFCNLAVRQAAQAMGCVDFSDPRLLADDFCRIMAAGGKWSKVDTLTACLHALDGGFGVAAMTSAQLKEQHGHVATIYPVGSGFSPSLQRCVPRIANVGREVGMVLVSAAFPYKLGEPDYFVYKA
jgi:hypothetical protein